MQPVEITYKLTRDSSVFLETEQNNEGNVIGSDYGIATIYAKTSTSIVNGLQLINGTHPRLGKEGGYPIKKLYLYGPENNNSDFANWPKNAPWPNMVIYMDVFSNRLTRISSYPSNLKELVIGCDALETIDNLPNSLERLEIWNCDNHVDFEFSPNLKSFVLRTSHDFKNLPQLPLSIEEITIDRSVINDVSTLVNHAIVKKYNCTFEFSGSTETYNKFVFELGKANEEMKAKLIWDILKEADNNLVVRLMVEKEGLARHLSERHFTNVVVIKDDIRKQEESGICIIL